MKQDKYINSVSNKIIKIKNKDIILASLNSTQNQIFKKYLCNWQKKQLNFNISLQQTINKLNSRSFFMIRANREIIPDRRLFDNIHKHTSLEIDCQPHAHSDLQQIALKMFHNIQLIMKQKLDELQTKIVRIDDQVNRLKGIMKYKMIKQQKKLFSFANSPNQKYSDKIPQSAKKYLTNQTNYPQNTTQSKKQHNKKQKYIQKQQFSYLNEQIIFLNEQIQQLKIHINKIHGKQYNSQNIFNLITEKDIYSKQNNINQSNKYKSMDSNKKKDINIKNKSLINYQYDFQDIISQQMDQKQIQNQTISRYKNVILQYKKQEQILRIIAANASKYKESLRNVLHWIRQFKQQQLSKYIPCQACRIKNFVLQFLDKNNKKSINNTKSTNNNNQQKNKRQKIDIRRLQVYNYQQQDNYGKDYQMISPEDQLLVEYQRQDESDDQFTLSDS